MYMINLTTAASLLRGEANVVFYCNYGNCATGCGRCGGEAADSREHPAEPCTRCLPTGGNFHPIQSPEDKTGHDDRSVQ